MRLFSPSNNSSFHPVRRWFYWQPVVVCLLFFLLAAGAIGFFLNDLASRANQNAEKTSNLLITTAIGVIEDDLSRRMVDYSWWNDMYNQVSAGLDPEWADGNIGSYLQDTFSYAGTYVLSPEGEVIFDSRGTEVLPENPEELLGTGYSAFLSSIQGSPMDDSIARTTVAVYNSTTFIIAGAPVTPEEPTEEQMEPHTRPVMIFLRELTNDVLSEIGRNYGVSNPRLVFGQAEHGVPLMNALGTVEATVIWDSVRPGDEILIDLIPKLAIVSLLLIITASTIYFMWIKAALSASEAKAQLLAKMSHELRTPLNPILGFSQMMIGETVGPIAPIYRGYAEDIHKSASHLRNVIDGLLDFSKIDAGKLLLREDPLELGALIDSVIHLVGPMNRTDSAGNTFPAPSVSCSIAEELPGIRGDELRIRQVLINVLSNAIKFSEGRPIEIRAFSQGDSVKIAVDDQGIGISREDQKKLFEPFVQANSQKGPVPTSGTGLGLVISRELMRLHGGELDLQSTLGEGTTVTLTFPASRTIANRP